MEMFELVNKQRNKLTKNKKGFTLVEVIVVLVILAILAAILIPTMIGWINKANEKSAIVEARSITLAAQTLASEKYNPKAETPVTQPSTTDVLALAEITGNVTLADLVVDDDCKVASFTYTSADGTQVEYSASANEKYTITTP